MIPVGGKMLGARITDGGFWAVIIVAVLAGALILAAMKITFDEAGSTEEEKRKHERSRTECAYCDSR